jgi:hypothetical protein
VHEVPGRGEPDGRLHTPTGSATSGGHAPRSGSRVGRGVGDDRWNLHAVTRGYLRACDGGSWLP